MSKSILLSIRPQWVAKILNKEKTIEVRKQFPKDYIGWVYIYCTKDYKNILFENGGYGWRLNTWTRNKKAQTANNGKVVARFWCDKVEEITPNIWTPIKEREILEKSCLSESQLFDYANLDNRIKPFYVIHISKLEIFDKPRELSEFYVRYRDGDIKHKTDIGILHLYAMKPLTKAPQNYLFVEELDK